MGVSNGKEALEIIHKMQSMLGKEQNEALQFAEMAIGYRIKKKPLIVPVYDGGNKKLLYSYYGCPMCKEKISKDEYTNDGYHFEYQYDVCHECGQLIDWEGIEGVYPK